MKKIIITAAAIALTLAFSITAFAASPSSATARNASGTRSACTYRTHCNNTVCSNTGSCTFVDENGDGICDNSDTHCTSFVDSDNNGICDNCKNQHTHNGSCLGNSTASCGRTGSNHSSGHHGGRCH